MEPRKRAILKAVVHEFTESAIPVGSQALVSRYFLNLSSATIRNELSNLGDLGYLIQPHTSSGRQPSDLGYRYFVDFLMDSELVASQVGDYISEQIRNAPPDGQAFVEKIAMVVATVTQNAAVVTTPHGPRARLKHLDLVSLEPDAVLLILLMEGNLLRQQVLELSKPMAQEALTKLANRILSELAGQDREAIAKRIKTLPAGPEQEVLQRIDDLLDKFEQGAETLVVHDGVRNLLKQPEFSDANRLQEVLEILEESRHLSALLRELIGESDLQVVIGSENGTEQLRSCTVALTTYGPSGRLKGTLGVVGPTRMQYAQIVGRLGAVARAASERMAEMSN
ncbi:MAG: heat-inducible transcriptional repressor HrcA [Candidatus Dormibacteraeota bacterium]|nr:heat-inducible transcriptional repressor HrcA [Candidatus Dormibacteraeota bacterium]